VLTFSRGDRRLAGAKFKFSLSLVRKWHWPAGAARRRHPSQDRDSATQMHSGWQLEVRVRSIFGLPPEFPKLRVYRQAERRRLGRAPAGPLIPGCH
jgi:hypothetical protein